MPCNGSQGSNLSRQQPNCHAASYISFSNLIGQWKNSWGNTWWHTDRMWLTKDKWYNRNPNLCIQQSKYLYCLTCPGPCNRKCYLWDLGVMDYLFFLFHCLPFQKAEIWVTSNLLTFRLDVLTSTWSGRLNHTVNGFVWF